MVGALQGGAKYHPTEEIFDYTTEKLYEPR